MANDAIIKSWLFNSMTDALVAYFVQFDTTKYVWDAVKRSYFDVSDLSQVYELMKKILSAATRRVASRHVLH